MKRVFALVGLSGVGKSTLIRAVHDHLPLLHLQASNLIKEEQARQNAAISSSEQLRLGPVLDNQQLLVNGFAHASAEAVGLVIFDGHAVIFGEDTATEIPSDVFRSLGCERIIMVEADPKVIRTRRATDPHRARPDLKTEVLDRQQRLARQVAERIATDLSIDFQLLQSGDINQAITSFSF